MKPNEMMKEGNMKLESKNKLFEALVVLLVLVVATQSVVIFKLYQRGEASIGRTDTEPFALDLVPRAGVAQPPSAVFPG